MKIRTHRELEVYRIAFAASMKIFNLSKSFPKEETYSLTDQIRRSSRSVCSNIAEAFRNLPWTKSDKKPSIELYADIVNKGIYLAGGGALLRGLDKRLSDKININFNVVEDPLHAVAKGTGVALKNVDKFPFLMR